MDAQVVLEKENNESDVLVTNSRCVLYDKALDILNNRVSNSLLYGTDGPYAESIKAKYINPIKKSLLIAKKENELVSLYEEILNNFAAKTRPIEHRLDMRLWVSVRKIKEEIEELKGE